MAFIDFAELKAKSNFSDALKLLGLALKQSGNQWRGPCPACKTGGDRALVVTEDKGYFCFADKKGGDQIALVAHVMEISAKDAADELARHVGLGVAPSKAKEAVATVPQSEGGKDGDRTFQPLSYLEPEHDAVVAIGFDTAFTAKYGIGYAPRGILRGTVAIPFRDEKGNLLGYIGATDLKLPPSFTPNIVELKRPA